LGIQALGDDILVDPLYDPDRASSGLSPGAPALYLPDSGRNPISQQGIVLDTGPRQWYLERGDHVLFHPFLGWPFRENGYEYLRIEARTVVGWCDRGGGLHPMPDSVVVLPHFKPAGRPVQKGLLWVPSQVFYIDVPCTGRVVRVGELVTELKVGEYVLFPHDKGNEIGLQQVYYTIREADILATLSAKTDATITIPPGG
jgi:co-chaperonin GroES (HSP10)